MTTLPNTGTVLPTRGAPGAGQWGDALDAALSNYDDHDHSSGKGRRINSDAIQIDADLTMGGFGLTNLERAAFAAITALTSGARAIFADTSGDLWYRNSAGVNVKIVAGNSLNVSAFIGGIGGDYSAIEALLDYDDATDTYRFRQQLSAGVRQYAKIRAGDLLLFEYAAAGSAVVPSFAVTLKSPAALAAPYALTMPAALPGSTSLVQLSSAGVLSASNTVANAVTLSSTLAVTGASTLTGGVANNVTLSAGATVPTGQHITLQGTSDVKHGSRSFGQGCHGAFAVAPGTITPTLSADTIYYTISGTATAAIPIRRLIRGDKLISLTINGGSANEPTAYTIIAQGAGTGVSKAFTSSGTFLSGAITLTLNTPFTLADDNMWLTITAGATVADVYRIIVTFDRP